MTTINNCTKVFISYSHKDDRWRKKLLTYLKPLEQQGRIECWSDDKIKPGTPWIKEIRNAIDTSNVAILLVTQDFLASDFITTNELPALLSAAARSGFIIIPIIVSKSTFNHSALSEFKAINDPGKPLDQMKKSDQNVVLVRLAEAIMDLAAKT